MEQRTSLAWAFVLFMWAKRTFTPVQSIESHLSEAVSAPLWAPRLKNEWWVGRHAQVLCYMVQTPLFPEKNLKISKKSILEGL